MTRRVRCGSPTCAASIVVSARLAGDWLARVLTRAGWRLEPQPGDGEARWYCRRCRL